MKKKKKKEEEEGEKKETQRPYVIHETENNLLSGPLQKFCRLRRE